MKKLVTCTAALVALTGCDVATEVAGDAIAGEIRTRYIEQCQGIAESAGIAAERIDAACECSADNFKEDFAADGQLDINRERMEEVLRICIQDDTQVVPAEG
ncbi:MAG: hypothetical protein CMN71_00095 [Sphingomonadaceae bacterium]|nr:hypothetical protein [Sphingomonadaceae bacterium]MBQ94268.1 hypothetical protein [Actinomycetota bacterium]|tara:strand:- start:305 stop:610 length:306 start_codon:yes stop_codon:yes gene_type:complete